MNPDIISTIRQETPGLKNQVFFNSAGSSLPAQSVLDSVTDFLIDEAKEGGYEIMMNQADKLQNAYHQMAAVIGANAEEIAFCTSSTDASYRALSSIDWKPGDEILISRADYGANTMAYQMLARRFGVVTRLVEDNEEGEIDLEHLQASISSQSRMVVLTHVPTSGGLVNPVTEVGQTARQHGLIYLLDACQSVGQLPIDVREIGCHILTATGRKYLRGPRGSGFLFVSNDFSEACWPDRPDLWSAEWGEDSSIKWMKGARRFENFEFSRALLLGLGNACQYYLDVGPVAAWERILQLSAELRSLLGAIPGVEVLDKGKVKGGIVTFRKEGIDEDEFQKRLMKDGIQTSVARPGTAWLDLPQRGIEKAMRASLHYFNTLEDLELLEAAVRKA